MSSFISNKPIVYTWLSNQLCKNIVNVEPRGGASIIEVDDCIIMFGGANRQQENFNDLIIYRRNDVNSTWKSVDCHGDIPASRSGHAVAAYGRFMLLFGGIDFTEEKCYNDLYCLNIDTLEWKYVGEAGVEITARNSHSMSVITNPSSNDSWLVIYGGASPELGPLGDTYAALLPNLEFVADDKFFVTWLLLQDTNLNNIDKTKDNKVSVSEGIIDIDIGFAGVDGSGGSGDGSGVSQGFSNDNPGCREMHSTSSFNGSMVITGGRNSEGTILSDVWILSIRPNDIIEKEELDIEKTCEENKNNDNTNTLFPLKWIKRNDWTLSSSRCAHGAAIINNKLCVYGGFTGEGVAGDLSTKVISDLPSSVSNWISETSKDSTGPRFGFALCQVSNIEMLTHKGTKKTSAKSIAKNGDIGTPIVKNGSAGLLVFGGVSAEADYGDVWLFNPIV